MESDFLKRVESLYRDYLRRALERENNRKIGEGLFGLTPGPADDPCHARFAADLEALLKEGAAASPSSGEAAAVLRTLYEAPAAYKECRSAYWMLIAVQGLGLDWIGFLDAADAAALRDFFAERYPRWERLPVQDQIFRRLRQRAK